MEFNIKKMFHSIIIIIISYYVLPQSLFAGDSSENYVSRLGQYSGYSEQIYDGWQRSSVYLPVRDGTKIAIDIFRPTKKGQLHKDQLPVIWEHRRYQRASLDENENIFSQLDRPEHPMRKVVLYGYIFAVAAVRGSGASFGTRIDPVPPQESLDAYDITEWLAAQTWCNGKVGMYGISYSGTDQLMAASAAPPHLKAIFPEMAMFDLYNISYPGGIYRHTFMNNWAQQIKELDLHISKNPAPVDGSSESDMAQALSQHKENFNVEKASLAPFRDSEIEDVGAVFINQSPSNYTGLVNNSNAAVYLRAGWFDMYPRDMLLWFNNLEVPKKIIIGPWNHYQSNGVDRAVEMLRWYDYWLKDIDNGIMSEPSITYGVIGLPLEKSIRSAKQWPPLESENTLYYFCEGLTGSIDSVNDGFLNTISSQSGSDTYTVDYTATSGMKTRWTGNGEPSYQDMRTNDRKAITYTTETLVKDIEIAGHPVIHIWIKCPVDDLDVFAYLEEVEADGKSTYITDGCLRASHRKLSKSPYSNMELPYHSSSQNDIEPLTDKPVELVFDLHPTANLFDKGHRIRISITCADKDNCQTPKVSPPPEILIYRNAEYPSYIVLPVYGFKRIE